jgi:hypothetical protein
MTTPTNENRDTDRATEPVTGRLTEPVNHPVTDPVTERAEPESRSRLDLSVTKIAAGATAAALAAAVGSRLGMAGTIVGAAVASMVATSASALIGHSIERGKTAARKAMPALDAEQFETAILPRARGKVLPPLADRALADRALDETLVLDGGTHAAINPFSASGPNAQTVVLPKLTLEEPRSWKDRLPGRKPLIAAAVASFVIGTGAVTALEVARKGEFPGYHSNVDDPGQGGNSNNQPAPQYPGGSGTHEGSTPSQKPDSSSATPGSGSSSQTPSTTPSTAPTSGSSSSGGPTTPSTGPTSGPGPTTPSTTPTTPPTSTTGPTTSPSTSGVTTPSPTTSGAAKATPSGGAAG